MNTESWGRVDPDGTVWVRTAAGERSVGSYPGASEDEALAYFTRKFTDLEAQVNLLEQRISAGHLGGQAANTAIDRLAGTIPEANAVGDLDGLLTRLQGMRDLAQSKNAQVAATRAAARSTALAERTALVEEAEALVAVDDERLPWKTTGDRLRELFDAWRVMQRENRLDKHSEDELWKRFSHARTTFDRKRRQHFGALDDQRAQAKRVKEQLVAQAEELAATSDWTAGASGFRELMSRWKVSGRAGRRDEELLWARFRAAQDTFFAARNAAVDQADAELRGNLEVKLAILTEAEALLPVKDASAARAALRGLQERWDEAGRVPRADLNRVEGRLRAVEQAVRDAEQNRWAASNPQARARAQDAVDQLETTIASLQATREKALAAGNERKVRDTDAAIAARKEWLVQARAALAEFGG